MYQKILPVLLTALFVLGGCAENPVADNSVAPERDDTGFYEARNSRSDELYLNPDSAKGGSAFRKVYVAPANLAKMQVIQPEGASGDEAWDISDIEDGIIQNALREEFTIALGYESAFNVVETREESEMVINTTVVAIHPNATRAEVAAGARRGGAITVSMALVNTATGNVMVRSVDTKSTDDIWAFDQIDNEDPAIDLIFRSWGNSMRRGLLNLQGRSNDPLAQPLLLKERQ